MTVRRIARAWICFSILAVLLAIPGDAQEKFRRADGTAIPGQYIVVLVGTDFNPVMPTDAPEPTPTPTGPTPTAGAAAAVVLNGGTATPAEPTVEPSPDPVVVTTAADLTATYGGTSSDTWGQGLKGFKLTATEAEAMAMSQDPRVVYIEEDAVVEGTATQLNPSWGLDRIDQRSPTLNQQFVYGVNGTGVIVYVIDSGILPTHVEFRDASGNSRVREIWNSYGSASLCHSHGTAVASVIAGRTYGIAKNARLYSLRVLDCSNLSSVTKVLNAVNYVTYHRQKQGSAPAVVNMSLTFETTSTTLDTMVRYSISKRIVYVVAAGNSDKDVREFTPARIPEAITVGATDRFDRRAIFSVDSASNWGIGVDLFAPGLEILSAWATSNTASINDFRGTSAAAPHVAGVAALYLQRYPGASPATVQSALVTAATSGVVSNPGTSTPNRLLFTSY